MKLLILIACMLSAQFSQARCYEGHGNWDYSRSDCSNNGYPETTIGYYSCEVGSSKPVRYYSYSVYLNRSVKEVYVYASMSFNRMPTAQELQSSKVCKQYSSVGQPCEILSCQYK